MFSDATARGAVALALVCRDLHFLLPALVQVCGISPCIKPGAGGRVCPRRRGLVLKERRAATSARACPQLRARRASHAAGPVVSVGRPSARRGPGLEIQGPQCAFETSMFMCPAVHMSTRNLLRSSSTHEPSDPPFRVVSLFAEWHIIGQVRPFYPRAATPARPHQEGHTGTQPAKRRDSARRSKAFHIVRA